MTRWGTGISSFQWISEIAIVASPISAISTNNRECLHRSQILRRDVDDQTHRGWRQCLWSSGSPSSSTRNGHQDCCTSRNVSQLIILVEGPSLRSQDLKYEFNDIWNIQIWNFSKWLPYRRRDDNSTNSSHTKTRSPSSFWVDFYPTTETTEASDGTFPITNIPRRSARGRVTLGAESRSGHLTEQYVGMKHHCRW
jgi:hypothetical protein